LDSVASILSQAEPFDTVPEAELARLEALGKVSEHEAGAVLVQPGESLDGALILVDGTVSEERGDGAALHQGPGPVLVAGALLTGRPSDHAVRAETAVTVVALPRTAFEALLEEQSPLGQAILRRVTQLLVQRVRLLNQRLNELLG
jgi:CBS domain-containing protein